MVRNNLGAGLIQNPYDIALYIKDIVILCPVIVKPISVRLFIVQENDSVTALGLAQQGAVHHMILGCRPIYRFAGANSIRIVGIRNRITIMRYRRQSSPVLPGKGETIAVGEGVADLIVGDGLAVKAGQQVFPACIRVAVGSPLPFRWTPCWSVQNLYSRPN